MDADVRTHLINMLTGRNAHVGLEDALADLPKAYRGKKTDNLPYTIWQQLEHLRIAQRDILEFCRSAAYTSPEWPEEYWPDSEAPKDDEAWTDSITTFKKDHQELVDLISNTDNPLFEPFEWGDGQTLFREAVLVIDHNSYHIGQIILIRKLLGVW